MSAFDDLLARCKKTSETPSDLARYKFMNRCPHCGGVRGGEYLILRRVETETKTNETDLIYRSTNGGGKMKHSQANISN